MNVEQAKTEINNLIAKRNIYYTIVIALTGGSIGLMYNLNGINTILFSLGVFMIISYILKIRYANKTIYLLLWKVGN